jgi:hypothetical protein
MQVPLHQGGSLCTVASSPRDPYSHSFSAWVWSGFSPNDVQRLGYRSEYEIRNLAGLTVHVATICLTTYKCSVNEIIDSFLEVYLSKGQYELRSAHPLYLCSVL